MNSAAEDHLVVAGLLIREDMVLLCHRSADRRWFPNVWDLPGGHVEAGETTSAALVRELQEELGIEVTAPTSPEIARLQGSNFDCRIWAIREWSGTPHCASDEHDQIEWFSSSEIGELPLADDRYRDLLDAAL